MKDSKPKSRKISIFVDDKTALALKTKAYENKMTISQMLAVAGTIVSIEEIKRNIGKDR